MAAPSFASMANGYRAMWKSMRITRQAACDQAARRILAARDRYVAVERVVGVPWFVIGMWHMRESSNNFAGVLHNGEHIIGTGRKTRLVPAGRGPFTSWEEAAVDAIKLKGLHKITDWSIERALYEFERFNGFGYHWKRQPSPYVWAGTTFYKSGKYVRDGVYDPSHVDTQMGCAAVCKSLEGFGVVVDRKPVASPKPKPLPVPDERPSPNAEDPDEKPAVQSKTIWASLIGIITSIGGILTDWRVVLIIVIALFVFIAIDRFLKWDIRGWFRA
jgi:lysozyme family protein